MMASRDIEKIKFPILDMLKKEQQKNISTEEKDEFSEILQEDFKICLSEFSYEFYNYLLFFVKGLTTYGCNNFYDKICLQ